LASWKDRPASASAPDAPSLADQLDPADYERAITGFARNVQPLPHGEGALPPIDVAGATGGLEARFRAQLEQTMAMHGWASENVQLRRQAAREVLTAWQNEPRSANYGDAENLAAQLPTDVYERVVYGTAKAAGPPPYDQKEKGIAQMTESKRRDDAPMYGSANMEATRLGGAENYLRLREIARELHLRLDRSADRRRAERILFSELGDAAGGTASFAMELRMSEGEKPEPPQYGSRGRPTPTPSARDLAFSENVAARLRTMDMLDPHRVAKAYRAEAAMHPQLTPDYGWSTRARRARG